MIKIGLQLLISFSVFITPLAQSETCISQLCLTSEYEEAPIKYVTIEVDGIAEIMSIENPNLPPDPGPEGKFTLLGIDSDGDGIRDDIYRYVVNECWDNAHASQIYLKEAKVIQNILKNNVSKSIVEAEF